jgi:hypothetical protein
MLKRRSELSVDDISSESLCVNEGPGRVGNEDWDASGGNHLKPRWNGSLSKLEDRSFNKLTGGPNKLQATKQNCPPSVENIPTGSWPLLALLNIEMGATRVPKIDSVDLIVGRMMMLCSSYSALRSLHQQHVVASSRRHVVTTCPSL